MKRYTKYEFIENTNNKELNDLFENPSYEEISSKDNNELLGQEGYANVAYFDMFAIIAVLGMIISFLIFKVVS